MKSLINSLVIGLFFVGAAVAQAGSLSEEADYYPFDPVPVTPAFGYVMAPVPVFGASYAFCRADTICPNGVPIGCYAYGNAATYTACNWKLIAGQYVECNGLNDLGIWSTAWARCF